MAITVLEWHDLTPDIDSYQEIFMHLDLSKEQEFQFCDMQPRLYCAFEQLLHSQTTSPWLLIKAPEEEEYLTFLADILRSLQSKIPMLYGGIYHIEDNKVTFRPAKNTVGDFTVTGNIITANWVETEQLFGCLREFNGKFSLHPGLVHKANGSILVIILRTLLVQPLLWLRLKSIVVNQRFEWITYNELHPLPISVPPMPISLKVVLIGERKSLAKFQEIEPEIMQQAVYSEFEDYFQVDNARAMKKWCQWVINIARRNSFPLPTSDAWPVLIQEAVRYTGDQKILPLCLLWLIRQLREVISISGQKYCNGKQLALMFSQREWREGFLIECMQNEILHNQVLVETEGKRIGQINSLSIIEFPGYPRVFGGPSRISCVVYIGDGEFANIERKAELSGNIHTKGAMIMQAFLMSRLQLDQQIPFSASLTFEQSYNEVDGDSASMAELCALISALADVPINQNIAITGSVDQFGRTQPVSGLNEKIEGFFDICFQRGLTGKQGVIIPAANIRHLSLHQKLINAVKEQKFFIWAFESIIDALPLLTNLTWDGEKKTTLIKIIQKRIVHANQQSTKRRNPWLFRYFS